jgi:hypothetical protein
MNAGPDVERLIADWLVEEAPARAPDRILDLAATVIDRTKQRRFAVAWREPMTLSIARFVAILAIATVVVGGGAAWIGRSTAGIGVPPATEAPGVVPVATPGATPSGPILESYRAARDAVCKPLNTRLIALNAEGDKLHPTTTPADLPPSILILQQIIAVGDEEIPALAALAVPGALAAEHATDVGHHRDSVGLLRAALANLQAGKVAEAHAIGEATNTVSAAEEAFEAKYDLAGCP